METFVALITEVYLLFIYSEVYLYLKSIYSSRRSAAAAAKVAAAAVGVPVVTGTVGVIFAARCPGRVLGL